MEVALSLGLEILVAKSEAGASAKITANSKRLLRNEVTLIGNEGRKAKVEDRKSKERER